MTIGDTSRVALRLVEETSWGETPALPMRALRAKSQSLDFNLRHVASEEFRADRQVADVATVDAGAAGAIGVELSFGAADPLFEAGLFGRFAAVAHLSGAAATSTSAYGVASGGGAFAEGHLLRGAGFAAAGNNGLHRVASATGTAVTVAGTPLAVEATAAGQSIRAVGFEGEAGDIAAVTGGLESTDLDFTTLGLAVGQWIAIGGAASGQRFVTAADNGWARIAGIAAHALALDHRPEGWMADPGTGRTIRVFFGDVLHNGIEEISHSIERAHDDIGQVLLFRGQMVRVLRLTLATGRILEASFDLVGRDARRGTASFGTGEPVPAGTAPVMNAVGDVLLVREGGAGAGIVRQMTVELDNNLREVKAVGALGNVAIGVGDAAVGGTLEAYFQDGALYDKYLGGTETSFAFVAAAAGQAYVVTLPRVKLAGGRIEAGSRNADCVLRFDLMGLRDPVTGCSIQIDRLPEFAA
ncbi:hypothetical protein EDC65_1976 [Stella humosa]|uniref:Uncharacterized protein n=1 Tax=Stella humosa TaxID=94 RepID=A0A3N1MBQ6_9PROT|nr:phage tail tube protein [Stella humosa]ROQ00180.1 hypothetical protein EDC65_1976 [Stella humosa]BBK30585.1 hypothetical protein STHU_12190 [Stella humosa]